MSGANATGGNGGLRRIGVSISGTGLAVPGTVLTNHDLEKMVDTSDEWIVQRTGIRQRYVSRDGETTTGLAASAINDALKNAGLTGADLDLVICATLTQDMVCPATACQIAAAVRAQDCGAMDLGAACTGFVSALNTAANFVASGMYKHVAIVGAEQLSKVVNWEDRNTCILFGDGAGAAIISATDDGSQGCIFQSLGSDGSQWQHLYCPRSEADVPEGGVFNGMYDALQMNGREVFKFAVTKFQAVIAEAMDAVGMGPDDVKVVIPHQSNIRIIESARKKLGLGEDKVYVNLDRYGNTSAASVGICLHELMEAGSLEKGDMVVFVAFGGGLTWGSSVWRL